MRKGGVAQGVNTVFLWNAVLGIMQGKSYSKVKLKYCS